MNIRDQKNQRLSIVAPAYNEAKVLDEFQRRLGAVLDELPMQAEIIYVNDGSVDSTRDVLDRLREFDPRIAVLELSRNFGKEVALTAGLDHADGDAVVVIDVDLQDPPELIPKMIACWQEGYDVVYGRRTRRFGETWVKRATAAGFYRFMQQVGPVSIPADTGDFRLLSRRAVEAVRQFRETHRFMKGLFSWIGFPQKALSYERGPRFSGESKWSYWRLWNLALEGITSFTVAPLKAASYLGLVTAMGAFLYGTFLIVRTLVFGTDLPGYPSIMVVILFLGGIQLIALGVIGEYLGRTFHESKGRPLYFVDEYLPPREQATKRERLAAQAGGDAE